MPPVAAYVGAVSARSRRRRSAPKTHASPTRMARPPITSPPRRCRLIDGFEYRPSPTVPGGIRTFVALDLPEAHRETLAAHLAECARVAPAYHWVEPDALHLTLRFIGHQEPAVLDVVRRGLAAIRARPFRLALTGRGTFGPRASPRVVWLGAGEGLDRCTDLAAISDGACQAAGLEPDARGFRAHVTLARARREGQRLGDL